MTISIWIFFLFLSMIYCVPTPLEHKPAGKPRLTQYIFDDAHLPHDRNLIVHLFEWTWTDIEAECKNYLSKNGYGAVQVSVPTEHIVDTTNINGKKDAPWFHRYQPVSYKLDSRSGTEAQFIKMVEECNKVGVRILVDAVINHMSSVTYSYKGHTGHSTNFPRTSAGSAFVAHNHNQDFSTRDQCGHFTRDHFHDVECNADISNYNDRFQVQTCRLVSLADLKHEHEGVRKAISCFLNKLLDIGVMGFRIDASRHIDAYQLGKIFQDLHYLNPKYFGEKRHPFIAHEVIDHGNPTLTTFDYTHIGRGINFTYNYSVTRALRNYNMANGGDLLRIREGIGYGNIAGHNLLNFLDNHDTQRSEHDHIITHKSPHEYRVASAFMFASTYGVPRIMSSYNFHDDREGPPSHGAPDFKTTSPEFNDLKIGGCKNGWICEHRWPEIRRMANFRSEANGAAIGLISYSGYQCFGFARLGKGYFALNSDKHYECILSNVDTSLPDGEYCNLIAQDVDTKCDAHNIIKVHDGKATFKVPNYSVVAFSLSSRTEKVHNQKPAKSSLSDKPNTVIFLHKPVSVGTTVFLRGGRENVGHDRHMAPNANGNAIPIEHSTPIDVDAEKFPSVVYEQYRLWRQNDENLDFNGAEHSQGTVDGEPAWGTPMIYTTNDPEEATFNELNHKNSLGPDYWMVQLKIDCHATPTFLAKGVIGTYWEPNNNHKIQCGKVNILKWGEGDNHVV